jgi:hypothetical protein
MKGSIQLIQFSVSYVVLSFSKVIRENKKCSRQSVSRYFENKVLKPLRIKDRHQENRLRLNYFINIKKNFVLKNGTFLCCDNSHSKKSSKLDSISQLCG